MLNPFISTIEALRQREIANKDFYASCVEVLNQFAEATHYSSAELAIVTVKERHPNMQLEIHSRGETYVIFKGEMRGNALLCYCRTPESYKSGWDVYSREDFVTLLKDVLYTEKVRSLLF